MSKREKLLEEEALKRKEIRRRFRTLIRNVSLNRSWLTSGDDDKKITMNVGRNIAMLVREQRKIGILTMAEKGLIRSHHEKRSVEDRKNLVKLLSNLTCFSRLPPTVVARLVPIIKFMYLGPGRVIMKEGDRPECLYFILYGEVERSKKVYNSSPQGYHETLESIHGPGDSIGEVELIEGGLRRSTYTTSNDVELLVVFGPDFDEILRPVMAEQWHQRLKALSNVGYFEFYTKNQITHACKMATVKEFNAFETIYFEDKGQLSYVHFILSGECMILQCLKMKVHRNKYGRKVYKLPELPKDGKNLPGEEEGNTRDDIIKAIRASFFGTRRKSYDIDEELESDEDEESELTKIKRALRQMDLDSIDAACKQRKLAAIRARREAMEAEAAAKAALERKLRPPKRVTVYVPETFSTDSQSESFDQTDHNEEEGFKDRFKETESSVSGISENDSQMENQIDGFGLHFASDGQADAKTPQEGSPALKEGILKSSQSKFNNLNEETLSIGAKPTASSKSTTGSFRSDRFSSTSSSSTSLGEGSATYENRFIDVGTLSQGGIFGLGERMEHRVILARTKVQCLMLPRFWLFEAEQNPGNVWKRRRFILDSHIPSREELFQNFLRTLKWNKFKKDYINSFLDPDSVANATKPENIPLMLHVMSGRNSDDE